MAIINVTPDSFSDAGEFLDPDDALRGAEKAIADGADIVDVGGESTRPGSRQIEGSEETKRVVRVVSAIAKRFDIPVSIDTSKADVARAAADVGAEIINDISGLRFDPGLANVAAEFGTGLVLMHSRGEFSEMHRQPEIPNILVEVEAGLRKSTRTAEDHGVKRERIAVDVGVGFGKSAIQNLELLVNLGKIALKLDGFPILAGSSRKSFISKVAGESLVSERLGGSIAAAVIAVLSGANIIRAHDVAASVQAVKLADAAKRLQ